MPHRKQRTLPPYGETTDERSSVRKRTRSTAGQGSYAERTARLDLKVQLAKIVIGEMPQSPRARLLRIAILRRDEVLLDELLDLGRDDDVESA